MNILLCVTGSVAATVTDKTIKALQEIGEVKLAITETGGAFAEDSEEDVFEMVPWFEDSTEWNEWNERERVLHIDLVKWADVLVVAPLSANTLAKFWAGLCDNLVTCIFRAWPNNVWEEGMSPRVERGKPIIIAPAMNTLMWEDDITEEQIMGITHRKNVYVAEPITKILACGDFGVGAMANVIDIAEEVKRVTQKGEKNE